MGHRDCAIGRENERTLHTDLKLGHTSLTLADVRLLPMPTTMEVCTTHTPNHLTCSTTRSLPISSPAENFRGYRVDSRGVPAGAVFGFQGDEGRADRRHLPASAAHLPAQEELRRVRTRERGRGRLIGYAVSLRGNCFGSIASSFDRVVVHLALRLLKLGPLRRGFVVVANPLFRLFQRAILLCRACR